MTQRTGSVGS